MEFLSDFSNFFAINIAILTIGLLIVRQFPINFVNFIPIYAILSILNGILKAIDDTNDYQPIITSIIISIVALLIITILAGMWSSNVSQTNYEALLVFIGLFPWTENWKLSIINIVIAILTLSIIAMIRRRKAFKHLEMKPVRLVHLDKVLNKEQKQIFIKKASVIYCFSLIIAALLSTAIYIGLIY